MTIISKFGVTTVTNEGLEIHYLNTPYFIAKQRLWEYTNRGGYLMWDWLIHLVEKTWLSKEELNNFNNAFFFACDFFKVFRPDYLDDISTAQTLHVQSQMKDNQIRISAIKTPKGGISVFNPDEETLEYIKRCNEVRKPIEYLDLQIK